jgi:hypothetical protein
MFSLRPQIRARIRTSCSLHGLIVCIYCGIKKLLGHLVLYEAIMEYTMNQGTGYDFLWGTLLSYYVKYTRAGHKIYSSFPSQHPILHTFRLLQVTL